MKKLVKFALIVGAIVFLAKLVAAQKAKWEGLTESEVRDKIESRLPKQVTKNAGWGHCGIIWPGHTTIKNSSIQRLSATQKLANTIGASQARPVNCLLTTMLA